MWKYLIECTFSVLSASFDKLMYYFKVLARRFLNQPSQLELVLDIAKRDKMLPRIVYSMLLYVFFL